MVSHCGCRGISSPWSTTRQRTTLMDSARAFAPVPTSQHGLPQSHAPSDLKAAEYVFIRHDAHRGPLYPPYDGPFRVLEAGDKAFLVDVGGKPDYISLDRLKPAHLDLDRPIWIWTSPSGWLGPHGGVALCLLRHRSAPYLLVVPLCPLQPPLRPCGLVSVGRFGLPFVWRCQFW